MDKIQVTFLKDEDLPKARCMWGQGSCYKDCLGRVKIKELLEKGYVCFRQLSFQERMETMPLTNLESMNQIEEFLKKLREG